MLILDGDGAQLITNHPHTDARRKNLEWKIGWICSGKLFTVKVETLFAFEVFIA